MNNIDYNTIKDIIIDRDINKEAIRDKVKIDEVKHDRSGGYSVRFTIQKGKHKLGYITHIRYNHYNRRNNIKKLIG